ncbi:MAG: hydantoinase/oxoprolinase family protein, partial [Planctomycetota bacterium]
LRVGPESAGAMPGPACYGVGTEPTVTDAHVALGHLGADTLLGGGFRIDPDRSVRAIERLAKKLSLSPRRTAEGILAVADVTMRRALMRITGERAVDPASVPLVAYGGAGGLHAASLSAQLGMPGAWIPIHPGAFSALGLALAGDSVESTVAVLQPWSERNERSWRQQAKTLCREAAARLGGRGANAKARVLVRYRGQGGGLYLELGRRALPSAFAQLHRERFGFEAIDTPLELVQISARAERKGRPLPPLSAADGGKIPPTARRRRAPLGGSPVRFLRREDLPLRTRIEGPCILEEATAATRLPASFAATVTKFALQVHRSIY